jgi:hypothetical protein
VLLASETMHHVDLGTPWDEIVSHAARSNRT